MHDDDVKIYRNEETPIVPPIGEGERSAALFLQHQQNGNLAKCRELGKLLGTTFVDDAKHLSAEEFACQRQVLLSFVVCDELAGIIFDQLLQKSVQGVFYKTVEELNKELFEAITDNTAYTLYILDDRHGCEECLGATFAELCGKEGNTELADNANAMARGYRRFYADLISSYSFAEIE